MPRNTKKPRRVRGFFVRHEVTWYVIAWAIALVTVARFL